MRIGVLGAGAMGAAHAAAYASMRDVELAAIVARTDVSARKLAAVFRTRASTDLAAVLDDPTIDAVDIALPTRLHRSVAVAALERGKHVFCETPLAANVDDAAMMIAAARRHGRLLQVALLQRVADLTVKVREILQSAVLGAVRVISNERLWPGMGQDTHHGDALEELALFDIDYLLWCFGMPRSVHAVSPRMDRIDHVLVTLDYGDLQAFIEASTRLPPTFRFRIAARAICDRGALEWTLEFAAPAARPEVRAMSYPEAGLPEPLPVGDQNPYHIECARFVQVVRGQADPALLDAQAAYDGLRILAAARTALASGGSVVP